MMTDTNAKGTDPLEAALGSAEHAVATKLCKKCSEVQPLADFPRHPQMRDGYLNSCKLCVSQDVKRRNRQKRNDPVWTAAERARLRVAVAKYRLRIAADPVKSAEARVRQRLYNKRWREHNRQGRNDD